MAPSVLAVGDAVESRHKGGPAYYPGRVSAVNEDGTYAIAYDDGDAEASVKRVRLRFAGETQPSQLEEGMVCEARHGGGKRYFDGEVGKEHDWKTDDLGNSMYEVRYADGDFEPLVSRSLIMVQCETCTPDGVPIAKLDAKAKEALLREAAENNAPHMVKALLADGVNVDAAKGGYTALMGAGRDNRVAVLELLLAAGADPNASNILGYTVLMLSCKNEEIVTKLLEAGADPNGSNNVGYTVLMKAAQGGADKVVSALIKAGAEPRAKNDEGQTAMNFAKTNRIRTMVTKAMERAEETAAAAAEASTPEGATESEGATAVEGSAQAADEAVAEAEAGAQDGSQAAPMSAAESVAASKKALLEASAARQEAAEAAREANLDIKKRQLEASMLEAQKAAEKARLAKLEIKRKQVEASMLAAKHAEEKARQAKEKHSGALGSVDSTRKSLAAAEASAAANMAGDAAQMAAEASDEVTALRNQVAILQAQLAERDALIVRKDARISTRDAQLEAQTKAADASAAQLAEVQRELATVKAQYDSDVAEAAAEAEAELVASLEREGAQKELLAKTSRKLKGMLIESAAAAAREAQLQAELRAAIEGNGGVGYASGGGGGGGPGSPSVKWEGPQTAMQQPPSPRALLQEHRASALERKRFMDSELSPLILEILQHLKSSAPDPSTSARTAIVGFLQGGAPATPNSSGGGDSGAGGASTYMRNEVQPIIDALVRDAESSQPSDVRAFFISQLTK